VDEPFRAGRGTTFAGRWTLAPLGAQTHATTGEPSPHGVRVYVIAADALRPGRRPRSETLQSVEIPCSGPGDRAAGPRTHARTRAREQWAGFTTWWSPALARTPHDDAAGA